jgi:hypothetical protein
LPVPRYIPADVSALHPLTLVLLHIHKHIRRGVFSVPGLWAGLTQDLQAECVCNFGGHLLPTFSVPAIRTARYLVEHPPSLVQPPSSKPSHQLAFFLHIHRITTARPTPIHHPGSPGVRARAIIHPEGERASAIGDDRPLARRSPRLPFWDRQDYPGVGKALIICSIKLGLGEGVPSFCPFLLLQSRKCRTVGQESAMVRGLSICDLLCVRRY